MGWYFKRYLLYACLVESDLVKTGRTIDNSSNNFSKQNIFLKRL